MFLWAHTPPPGWEWDVGLAGMPRLWAAGSQLVRWVLGLVCPRLERGAQERERMSGPLPPALYRLVGEHHLALGDEQQQAVLWTLHRARLRYQDLLYGLPAVRLHLMELWLNRYHLSRNTDTSAVTSKLASDYNTSKRGLNQQIRQRVDRHLEAVRQIMAEHPPPWDGERTALATHHFRQANLHPRYFFSPYVRGLVEELAEADPQAQRALRLLRGIERRRDRLVRSVYKMAAMLASRTARQIPHDVLDAEDLFQEALVAAYESVFTLPDSTKWSTYVYYRLERILAKHVHEQQATVGIPRSLIDRWRPVQEALDTLAEEGWDYEGLAELANQINAERKLQSVGRALEEREFYTPDEVEMLIFWTDGQEVSLHRTTPDGSELSALLPDTESASPEDLLEEQQARASIQTIIRELLTEEEWRVLSLRWGLGTEEPYSLEETARIYAKATGGSVSRLRLAEIEERARTKLQQAADPRLRQLWER